MAWSVAPVFALLGLSVVAFVKPPSTWRRFLVVEVAFLLLTLLGLWDSLLDPDGSSTSSLGLLVLPIPQWLILMAGLVALLVGPDPDRPERGRFEVDR